MTARGAFLVLIPAVLFAQPPQRPRPWWDGEVARDLNLSDAQTRQIRETQKEFRPRMKELRDNVNKAEAELDAAFNEDPVDQVKANEAILRLAAAHSEMTKAVSQMDLKLRMILTPQQWQDLKEKQRHSWPVPGGRRGPPRNPGTNTNQK